MLRRRDAEAWFEEHAAAFAEREKDRISAEEWWDRRVDATWGLIARGAEAVPFAIKMLESSNPDIREDGAGILAEIGRDESAVDAVLDALRRETEHQPRDVLVSALGRMKSPRAIPPLAAMLRSPKTDSDTRANVVDALGQLARRRFDREADPAGAALVWLEKKGY